MATKKQIMEVQKMAQIFSKKDIVELYHMLGQASLAYEGPLESAKTRDFLIKVAQNPDGQAAVASLSNSLLRKAKRLLRRLLEKGKKAICKAYKDNAGATETELTAILVKVVLKILGGIPEKIAALIVAILLKEWLEKLCRS